MNSNQNSLLLYLNLAITIWFFSVSTSSGRSLEKNQTVSSKVLQQLPIVRFDVRNLNGQTYISFIDDLRRALQEPDARIRYLHGYTMMRKVGGLLLVELSNAPAVLTFLVDTSNAYLIAYRVGNIRAHYFKSTPLNSVQTAFPGVPRHELPFEERYEALELAADHFGRVKIALGRAPIQKAVLALYEDSLNGAIPMNERRRPATSITVFAQVIAEAARNFVIAGKISAWIQTSQPSAATPTMITFENEWKKLSVGVLDANNVNGKFKRLVDILDIQGKPTTVDNVNNAHLRNSLALVLWVPPERRGINKFLPLVIKSVVAIVDDPDDDDDADEDDDSTIPEDTKVSIIGPNGLCAGVKEGNYKNGNKIVLQHCKSSSDSDDKQQWTVEKNGMIQSKSKCLTASGKRPGDYVMIQDCPPQVTHRTHWKVCENGTIKSETGLVLSAKSGYEGTKLTVEENINTLSQSWRPMTYTRPVQTPLVGLNNLCLRADGGRVWLARCKDEEEQKWYSYPDGSIRPHDNKSRKCLCANEEYEVSIVKCDYLSAGQRWEFKSDHTILNVNYDMVLAVAQSNPSLRRIVIEPSTGSPNQQWSPVI